MGGTTGTEPGRVQRVPPAPGTRDGEHGRHGLTLINAGPMAPSWVRLPWGQEPLEAFPQLSGHAPITLYSLLVSTHRIGSCGREFLPTGYHQHSLLA